MAIRVSFSATDSHKKTLSQLEKPEFIHLTCYEQQMSSNMVDICFFYEHIDGNPTYQLCFVKLDEIITNAKYTCISNSSQTEQLVDSLLHPYSKECIESYVGSYSNIASTPLDFFGL